MVRLGHRVDEAGEESEQKGSEVGEDLADVVPAAAEDGVECVTDRPFEGASGEATIRLHVADLRLDGAASPHELAQAWGKAAAGAADEHRRAVGTMAAVAAINHDEAWAGSGEGLHLLEGLGKGVPVVGIAGHGAHADDKAAGERGGDAHLAAELIAHPRLALGDAVHLRLMQGVDLAPAFRRLPQQAGDELHALLDPRLQPLFGHGAELAADVALNASRVTLQSPQHLAHAAELPGMGVPPSLGGQTRSQAVVGLP